LSLPEKKLSAGIKRLRKGLGRYRVLLAAVTLVAISLVYSLIFHHRFGGLVDSALPNAVASLAVFLTLYALYQFVGVSPLDEIAQILDRHRGQLGKVLEGESRRLTQEVQRLVIPRPRGIIKFYAHWSEMNGQDWDDILKDASEIDIVMNWCDSLIDANARLFRQLIAGGMTIALYLPHPGSFGGGERLSEKDRERLNRLANTYSMPRGTARLRIAESASKLVELGAKKNQITIRLLKGLTYSAVRVNKSRLLISHYDQFRIGHPRAHALLLDLDESPELHSYWTEQFERFEAIRPTSLNKMLHLRRSFGNRQLHRP
jgi:hypothetical protein